MINKNNWEETKKNFCSWWNNQDIGRPIMNLTAIDEKITSFNRKYNDYKEKHIGLEYRLESFMHSIQNTHYFAESYPSFSIDIGPGSLATYLGSQPNFNESTIWYDPCIDDYDTFNISYDINNYWLKLHLDLIQKAYDAADGKFLVNIPDIVENIDILSAMRDPQTLLFDMYDRPDIVKKFVKDIDDTYFPIFDDFYNIIKGEDSSNSYTAFNIWGYGRTAKVQCDFCSMISPSHFREFVKPTLEIQCNILDNSMYHLDGKECACHVPALMEIDSLNALQWTHGSFKPDGGCSDWFPIYKQVKDAGKSLWLAIGDGDFDDWLTSAKRIVNEFGSQGMYFHFPNMTSDQAKKMLDLSYTW